MDSPGHIPSQAKNADLRFHLLKVLCDNYTFPDGMPKINDQSHSNATEVDGTVPTDPGNDEFDALMYIIIVLMFYAISMTLLMVKYIKRERQEAVLDYYFNEFVKRENFNKKKFIFDKRTAKQNIIMKYIDGHSGLEAMHPTRTKHLHSIEMQTAV